MFVHVNFLQKNATMSTRSDNGTTQNTDPIDGAMRCHEGLDWEKSDGINYDLRGFPRSW
jgi:hypothetical protein